MRGQHVQGYVPPLPFARPSVLTTTYRSRTDALHRDSEHSIRSDHLHWRRFQRFLRRIASQEVSVPPFPRRTHSRAPSQDVVLCRRFRGLERKIADERAKGSASRLVCTVEYWSGAWEVEEKFKLYAQRTDVN